MCKISEYQYDEAILAIRPHAPKAAQIIEQYVEQLRREIGRLEYLEDCRRACTLLEKKG